MSAAARAAARAAVAVMPAAALARLGQPALITAAALAVCVLAAACWVLASDARAGRAAAVLAAWRGVPAPVAAVTDPVPARARWWRWRGRWPVIPRLSQQAVEPDASVRFPPLAAWNGSWNEWL